MTGPHSLHTLRTTTHPHSPRNHTPSAWRGGRGQPTHADNHNVATHPACGEDDNAHSLRERRSRPPSTCAPTATTRPTAWATTTRPQPAPSNNDEVSTTSRASARPTAPTHPTQSPRTNERRTRLHGPRATPVLPLQFSDFRCELDSTAHDAFQDVSGSAVSCIPRPYGRHRLWRDPTRCYPPFRIPSVSTVV